MGTALSNSTSAFLHGGGDAGVRIRGYDWSSTSLGPIDGWPATMKSTIGVMLRSRFPKAIAWGPELITFHNDAFQPILGEKPDAIGRPFSEVWSEVWDDVGPIADRALKGEATFLEDLPLIINRYGYPEQCYFTFCYSPIVDAEGNVVAIMDTVVETTKKVQTQQQSAILNAELAHRIRNTLSIVSAIAQQTMRSVETTKDALPILSDRLQALAGIHSLLTSTYQVDAAVRDIVETSLKPHVTDAARFSIDGPPIMLPERPALALALAVNELVTNAIKYGALSVDTGHVTIRWTLELSQSTRMLELRWRERGGPAVLPPAKESFGSQLLKRVVPTDFGGTATLTLEPEGVAYTLRCDYDRLIGTGLPEPGSNAALRPTPSA